MPPDPGRQFRARFSIRQVGVLVVFSAVASAVVMPQVRREADATTIILAAAIEAPYALILPALFLIRGGPVKNLILVAICATPVAGFLAYLNVLFFGKSVVPAVGPLFYLMAIIDVMTLAFLATLTFKYLPVRARDAAASPCSATPASPGQVDSSARATPGPASPAGLVSVATAGDPGWTWTPSPPRWAASAIGRRSADGRWAIDRAQPTTPELANP